jgi:putative ABC transport system permease protein
MVPIHGVAGQTWALGIGLMIVIGLIVGLVPAWRAMRLNIVDALSGR